MFSLTAAGERGQTKSGGKRPERQRELQGNLEVHNAKFMMTKMSSDALRPRFLKVITSAEISSIGHVHLSATLPSSELIYL